MVQDYLVTFKSTTATLRAKRIIDYDERMIEYGTLRLTAEVVPVPFSLSQSCYGMGIKCMATEKGIGQLRAAMEKNKIDFKQIWLHGERSSYTPVRF